MRGDQAAGLLALLELLLKPLLLLRLLSQAAALQPGELFPYGQFQGDQLLNEGDDESSAAVKLASPLRFYDAQFSYLYVGTNGIISTQDFPRETQYVDDGFPTDFPAIAPFLADIDTSQGRGRIFYREDTGPKVLGLAARYVRAGFPRAAASDFTPTHAFLATWEKVGAYEEVRLGTPPSGELNTFQAVLASDESDTYTLFLYPANGLQFFGTRPKEAYNVQLKLPARVGFCQGDTDDPKREGAYFSLTSTEQSVKNLYQHSNLGMPGVWAFHIGSASPLDNVRPAAVGGVLSNARSAASLEQPFSHASALEASNKETCEHNHRQCSRHAFCTDYATGFCCHCQSSFFGNGKHCLLAGAPLRVNGKVDGHLRVDRAPVTFTDVDLHAYIVSNDGRAYTAISHIPQPAAQALLPLTPIGGLFGWLFALEKPGWKNGFSFTGATFIHEIEVTFYPGKERVRITQTAEGLDAENYLNIKTNIQGQVPYIPANFTAHIAPYKELYHYSDSAVTSTSSRDYSLTSGAVNQMLSYHINQNITYQACRHAPAPLGMPVTQQLSVDRVFALYDDEERVLRFAVANQIGPAEEDSAPAPVNPCYDGTHMCDTTAQCHPGTGVDYTCTCASGYQGDGRSCVDVDECLENRCHPSATCYNTPGSFSCRCPPGYHGDGLQCTPDTSGLKTCERQQRDAQAQHAYPGARVHIPQCDEQGHFLPLQCHGGTGFCWCVSPDGHEVPGTRTPPGSNPPHCGPPAPTQRAPTVCERWRESLLEHYGGAPRDDQYVPQCDDLGHFIPMQCHGKSDFCWCVDKDGREVEGTRSQTGVTPACIPTVAPPSVWPAPRPDVTPPSVGTFLIYAQGQQIGSLPLNGTRLQKDTAKTLLSLHGSIVVGIDYDCRERKVYWTDVAGRTISRASLEPGAEPETIITSGLISPEGLAIDHFRRTMYWTDSGLDKIERAKLDGSERKALFHTDLVNPRAIAVDPIQGNLYWTDWNREAPKIEMSSLDGENRRILVNQDIGLPNGLTFDPLSKLLCWADAGTKKLECTLPDGTGRRVIQNNLNYPFSIVSYADHFYHTDWRRDGVISVNRDSGQFTDEYLPEQRSHLYGITAVYPYCPAGRK
ncbi:nidogen-2 [Phyllostomus hastatus]|uniref:nidogen-2 n=1 Tax=Phyllostomus hastatus TaxID=9423 RepID=UPI001E683978|nr:nidogen-2 [Phyllostomus hastatus]